MKVSELVFRVTVEHNTAWNHRSLALALSGVIQPIKNGKTMRVASVAVDPPEKGK